MRSTHFFICLLLFCPFIIPHSRGRGFSVTLSGEKLLCLKNEKRNILLKRSNRRRATYSLTAITRSIWFHVRSTRSDRRSRDVPVALTTRLRASWCSYTTQYVPFSFHVERRGIGVSVVGSRNETRRERLGENVH